MAADISENRENELKEKIQQKNTISSRGLPSANQYTLFLSRSLITYGILNGNEGKKNDNKIDHDGDDDDKEVFAKVSLF